MKTLRSSFFKILSFFLVWRVLLFFISSKATNFFTYNPSFPYADAILARFNLPQWLYSWGNFDGVHYITIVQKGYIGTGLIQAFFPGFPVVIKLINIIINNVLISGLVVSNLFFLLFLLIWYFFITNRYSKQLAFLSTLVILLFPTSFFFGAIYSESLFLLLVISTFWFIEKKQYLLTSITIFLASSTRIVGILLIPAVLIEIIFENYNFSKLLSLYLKKNKNFKTHLLVGKQYLYSVSKKIKPILFVSTGSLGLITYMVFLYKEFGDPLYFFHVQSEFGGIRQETLVSYPRVVFRYIKILLTARPFNFNYLSSVRELAVGIFGLIVILCSFKKVKFSYFVFALSAFLLPTLTGTFSSLPRYILVSFPIFIVIASWAQESKLFRYAWFILSAILLIINTMLFIQGVWVA